MRINSLILCAILLSPIPLRGQSSPDTLSLLGRKAVSIGFGLTGARSTTTVGGQTATHTDGQVGSLSYRPYAHSSPARSDHTSTR